MRTRSGFTITGGIVPPGTIPPMQNHPLGHVTPEERVAGARLALGRLILAVAEGNREGSKQERRAAVNELMKTAAEKKTAALLATAMKKLPARITCPNCGKVRAKTDFGLRVMAKNSTGVPTRVARQSWCRSCR